MTALYREGIWSGDVSVQFDAAPGPVNLSDVPAGSPALFLDGIVMKSTFYLALLFSGISLAQALDVGDISSFMNSGSSTLNKTIPKQYRQ